ncbi:MAG TPA: hypothetical protein VF399_05110, partial [bacterium]
QSKGADSMNEIQLTLPSGKKVKMREMIGLDQVATIRKFIGKSEEEKELKTFNEVALCIVEIEGMKKPQGYEDLLTLSNKDLTALLLAYNELNTLNPKEIEDLKSFFDSAPGSKSSAKNSATP